MKRVAPKGNGRVSRIRSLLKLSSDDVSARDGRVKDCPRRYDYLEQAGMARAAERL
ncbi:hypothetical protein [Mycobacterium angelicum]|uniref:hypothetical protein n=1 Tax=Mycobacterium angelicum TaxID=470074 RepID=UPI0014766732|nr:hypothetical protein [Mycobacterium angelicum]MCV7198181.1 hypothetical protein [Mycobacterium angelicum]